MVTKKPRRKPGEGVITSHGYLLHTKGTSGPGYPRAYDACGHADWRKCPFCKKYDAPENMAARTTASKGRRAYYGHQECANRYLRALKAEKMRRKREGPCGTAAAHTPRDPEATRQTVQGSPKQGRPCHAQPLTEALAGLGEPKPIYTHATSCEDWRAFLAAASPGLWRMQRPKRKKPKPIWDFRYHPLPPMRKIFLNSPA